MIAIIVIVAAFAAPVVAQPPGRVVPQRFVCERSHTNFAWGFRHAGIFVDGAGVIYSFAAEKHQARDPKAPPGLTEAEMQAKYGPAIQVGTVPPERLLAMSRLIPPTGRR